MKLERQLLQNLLNTWKRIKDIRRQEGCTNTPLRLIIKQLSFLESSLFSKQNDDCFSQDIGKEKQSL